MANSKSAGVGMVTVVEGGVFRSARIRARLTVVILSVTGGVLGAIVGAPTVKPLWGLVIGLGIGIVIGLLAGAVVAVWPVLRVLWHWSAEITAMLLVTSLATALSSSASWWLPVAVYAVVAAIVLVVPRLRRFVCAWVWCAIVRHRLRHSFAAFIRSRNRLVPRGHGGSPLILLARPTPAGERVWVWLRTGLDLDDLETNIGKLAVACWAADVRVANSSERHAALVRIDVTRRDPMRAMVGAPFLTDVPEPGLGPSLGPVAVGGLNLDDVPADAVDLGGVLPRPRGGGR
jgi:hypothetical protein